MSPAVEVRQIARSKSVLAEKRINPSKQVAVRKKKDGELVITLPDWDHVGTYHRSFAEVRPGDARALLECLSALVAAGEL